jgi:hypothetical protein
MPAPKSIPPKLHAAILRKAGEACTGPEIAAWLKSAHGVKTSARAVQRLLKQVADDRAPIAQAVTREKLAGTIAPDLDAVEAIIERARRDEDAAGSVADLIEEMEALARSDIGEMFDAEGAMLPLKDMPEKARRAIASIEIEQVDVEGSADDGNFSRSAGRVVKVKLWDKPRSLEQGLKQRLALSGRELAIKARDQQLRALALRLELSGAGNGKPVASVVAAFPADE